MKQIRADRMTPAHVAPVIAERIVLKEKVILAVGIEQTVGIVHPVPQWREMISWPPRLIRLSAGDQHGNGHQRQRNQTEPRHTFVPRFLRLCSASGGALPLLRAATDGPLLTICSVRSSPGITMPGLCRFPFRKSTTELADDGDRIGDLYLRKPGKMRWDYKTPAGKLFLSDGKQVYFYNPATNRAEKTKLKETEDMRAPLAFLLGKLDFEQGLPRVSS